MSSDDPIQRHLNTQFSRARNETFQFAKELSGKPMNVADVYHFQSQLMSESTANWANLQYTQFNFGMRKAIIDAT